MMKPARIMITNLMFIMTMVMMIVMKSGSCKERDDKWEVDKSFR